ncbi:hypothetical protein OS493_000230 [Desmophyllum pertusum]|uniref:Uncharacterized protein n=1 Tax=Desmophyllum pertusum TaxID=174260 RepID=A0A9X0DCB3_9CNID|nr:hypothetical protein OS493_000230 [Desmophyllum pertusum]
MAPKRASSTVLSQGTPNKRRQTTSNGKSKGTPEHEQNNSTSSAERDKHGKLLFADFPDFKPNMTPKEVLQAGSFGGTYFRPIHSSITGEKYSAEVYKEFPSDWFKGLNIKTQVTSSVYRNEVNTYKVKCGGSLEMWESSGWIHKQDPYGWFHWYCRFYLAAARKMTDVKLIAGRDVPETRGVGEITSFQR